MERVIHKAMFTEAQKKNILILVLNDRTPVGVKRACAAVRYDFSALLYVQMMDGTCIYGLADPYNHVTVIDAWDWLSLGGIYVLARERDIVLEPIPE